MSDIDARGEGSSSETGTEPPDAAPMMRARRSRRGKREALREEFEHQVAHARDQFEQQMAHARDQFEHARDQFEQANEKIKQRTGRDLIVAIVIGLTFGGILLASLLIWKWAFIPLVGLCALLGTFELWRAFREGGRRIDIVPQVVGAVLIVLTASLAETWLLWVALFVAVAFIVVWRLIGQMAVADGRTYGDVLSDVLAGAFVPVYVSFLASLTILLLRMEGGQFWVLSFVVVVVAVDTGAYASGLVFGKHPMSPRISPKKTWEGFAGAALASIIAGILLGVFLLGLTWWAGLVFGAVVLLTATLGDLTESMIKRDLGIKDISSWLPGHGGLLDRLDSILPSAAAALLLAQFLPLWSGS